MMIMILLRQVADRLGVIISPVEMLSEASSGGFIAAVANDWSTLGSALLATDERMNDPSSGPPPAAGGTTVRSSGSTPSTEPIVPSEPDGHAPRVPRPPPFPPPRSESSQEGGSEDEESDSAAVAAPWKRQRRQ